MRNYFLLIVMMLTLFADPVSARDRVGFTGLWFKAQDDFETAETKHYIIATPSQYLGKNSQGRTNIYKVHNPQDELVYSFDWFSPDLKFKVGKITDSKKGIVFTRISSDNIEFYFDGKMVKRYTSEELAKSTSVWASVRFWNFRGYKWIPASAANEGHSVFEIAVVSKLISFDPISGDVVGEREYMEEPSQAVKDMVDGKQESEK